VEEEDQFGSVDMTRQHSMLQTQHEEGDDNDDMPRSPRSMERIDAGSELIHVPQVADKRYSWEEGHDRI
jgi:hypothetical protein